MIVIVEYDPRWPKRFDEQRLRIEAALGDRAQLITHIGSTAVPGLAAKPTIDIAIAVDDIDDEAAYAPALEAAGYVLRVRQPGHRMFRTAYEGRARPRLARLKYRRKVAALTKRGVEARFRREPRISPRSDQKPWLLIPAEEDAVETPFTRRLPPPPNARLSIASFIGERYEFGV